MLPLLEQLGVDARWNTIKGNPEFFKITKKFIMHFMGVKKIFLKRI